LYVSVVTASIFCQENFISKPLFRLIGIFGTLRIVLPDFKTWLQFRGRMKISYIKMLDSIKRTAVLVEKMRPKILLSLLLLLLLLLFCFLSSLCRVFPITKLRVIAACAHTQWLTHAWYNITRREIHPSQRPLPVTTHTHTHTTLTTDKHSCRWRDSNPWSQQASGRSLVYALDGAATEIGLTLSTALYTALVCMTQFSWNFFISNFYWPRVTSLQQQQQKYRL
jgi:hypothetical protein